MSVHSKICRIEIWSVEKYVVRFQKLPSGHDLEAQTEDISAIDGIRIRVVDFEGSDGSAYSVITLLCVRFLSLNLCNQLFLRLLRASGGFCGSDEFLAGDGRDDGRGFDLELLPRRSN